MHIKLTTSEAIAQLHKGDVLWKYPSSGIPEDTFDEQNKKCIEAYEIRSVNPANEMMELVMTADSRIMFASQGDVGRLFIKSGHLITEKVWWL